VRASVRDPSDPAKSKHLTQLAGAKERLELVKADLLDEGSFDKAVEGCVGVFHSASPFVLSGITDHEKQLLQPAIQGSLNVLKSAAKSKTIRRVVLTSSMAAVGFNGGKLPETHVYTDADWSYEEHLRSKGIWYPLSKTLAEKEAWKFVAENKPSFDLIVVNPTLVIGPLLQPSLNTSTGIYLEYLNGKKTEIPNSSMSFVDVRDVANAHLICFENAEASGRYVCVTGPAPWSEWCEALRSAYPKGNVPTKVSSDAVKSPMLTDNSKLKKLGWQPITIQQSLTDSVHSLVEHGLLSAL